VLLVMTVIAPTFAISAPANDESFIIEQPDGSTFRAILRGDEWFNWIETVSGRVVEKSDDGFWYYVSGCDRNNLPVLSAIPANQLPLPSFPQRLKPCRQTRATEKDLRKENNSL